MGTAERPDPLAEPEGYGVRPGQQPEHPVATRCGADDATCKSMVCYRLWIGDANEHVWPLDLCEKHASQHVHLTWPMQCTVCKAKAQVIKVEGLHGHDPADLGSVPDERTDVAIRWAFGGPAGPGRFA